MSVVGVGVVLLPVFVGVGGGGVGGGGVGGGGVGGGGGGVDIVVALC